MPNLIFTKFTKIDSTSNKAERGLKHAVVIRKISNRNRSKDGAETTANLLAVLQTAKLQSDNPMNFMMDLLYSSKKTNLYILYCKEKHERKCYLI